MSQKPDAARGRFAVTEELEAWAKEQRARRERRDGSKFETDRRAAAGIVFIHGDGGVERYSNVALRPHDFELRPTGLALGSGVQQLFYPFKELAALEASDPWPGFELEWRSTGGAGRRRFHNRFDKESEEWAATVEKIFDHVSDRFGHVVSRGWLGEQVVAWERVDLFPDERLAEPEERGGYRLSAKETPMEEVIARRAAPSRAETLLDWLSSRPDYPWREHPREVVVTVSHVYVRRRDETVHRIAVSSLRLARKSKSGDAAYVFGRNTRLLLPHREGCAVMAALEAVLG